MIDEMTYRQFLKWYGDGSNGSVPRADQWAQVLSRDPDAPLTLINFFKFRAVANYSGNQQEISGKIAFDRYATVSIPAMDRVGGTFLMVAPFEATLIGQNEDWDLIAIGSYPNKKAFIDLYEDAGYRAAFQHRTAACLRQKVMVASA